MSQVAHYNQHIASNEKVGSIPWRAPGDQVSALADAIFLNLRAKLVGVQLRTPAGFTQEVYSSLVRLAGVWFRARDGAIAWGPLLACVLVPWFFPCLLFIPGLARLVMEWSP